MLKFFRTSNHIEGVYNESQDSLALQIYESLIGDKITMDLILEYHKSLVNELNSYCTPGELRNYAVTVGGRPCLKHEKVETMLRKLLRIKPKDWDEIKKWHVSFEKIHPFGDGNGRVGRMIMALQAKKARCLRKMQSEFDYSYKEGEEFEDMQQRYYSWFRDPEKERAEMYRKLQQII